MTYSKKLVKAATRCYYPVEKQSTAEDHISSPYFQFFEFLSPGECKDILEWAKESNLYSGTILSSNKLEVVQSYRDSKVSWLPVERFSWLYDRIFESAHQTNFWDYDIDGFFSAIQFSEYDGTNSPSYYNSHRDTGPRYHHRKISFVILLNDPEEFSGGEFGLSTAGKLELTMGSALMFPSFVEHRVHPVTEGKRYSLVSWISGPKLR